MARQRDDLPILSQQLLLGVAEEIKLPLLQIARQAEHAQLSGTANLAQIRASAQTALQLLDNYSLGVRLAQATHELEIEAVSVASVLYDTSQELDAMAKQYGVKLELNIAGRYAPVMANRQGLQAALTSLGSALIEALPALEAPQLKLQLASHRSRYGIVAGLYTDTKQLTNEALQKGRDLQGSTRQPLLNLTHTSGAGVFVADAILRAMNLNLKASRHHGLYGVGTVLQSNNQLQLI